MIEVSDLRKSFGSTPAVAGVTFDVRAGETFGLLGPNGAGKSTTIAMLTGALAPDSGTIRLADRGAPIEPAIRRLIGVAPQTLSLYEELTAFENLSFFGRMYGLAAGKLAERVAWALEFAELTERRRDRVKTFSGGMKRRLNLAVALVHEPQVIFLDEPTAGVDPQSRNHIFERIEQLRGEGRTVVYTTHYMEEAQRLCDRVAIMDHGKILDIDTIPALLAKYGGRAVVKGELVGPPRNGVKLPGTVDGLSLRFESERPLEQIAELSAVGVAFQTLEVARPDLETVFLSLTGRSLRD